ncbi:flagellar transcriptional regulator FlhD [Burkholderia ubonensis]|uniref:flagellar transcriptional regulator FlhD n=1 Tax=Burkholderia ubonensis TaxID=101571 RepID=UPI0007554994|nr:flagellar transcriptional regulator FlhD [Burkholderia ubonensis]KVP39828.1 hypothetical protein WJ87_06495 [Burkholderia ubonensis]
MTGGSNQILDSLREINLAYLVLAQRLLAEDRDIGAFRLGLGQDVAEIVAKLSVAQTVKLASSPKLLCEFRLDNLGLLASLAEKQNREGPGLTHAAIMMANAKSAEALA